MTTILSHDAFHENVGFAFGELLVLEQISQLPADSVRRVLQSIPSSLLADALKAHHPEPQETVAADERRRTPRRKILRGARVITGGRTLLEVQVRDISPGGCRIWSRMPDQVPEHFTIRIVGFDGDRPCEVRWRAGEEIGLRFLGG